MASSVQFAASPVADAVDRYFQVSLFLLITTGFTTLIATGRLDPPSVLLVGLALVFRAYLLLKNRAFKIAERWTTYFTLLYGLVFVVDLFVISGSYVTASIHLVLFSMVVKLFSVERERDYLYLAVLAFLAVLAASVLTVDTLFLGAFCLFVLLAVNTFVAMEIRRSIRKSAHLGVTPSEPRNRLNQSLTLTSGMMVVGIIIATGALFFVLPRFSAGYLSGFAPRNDLVTGFGNEVNLGVIGRIQQSDQVVMHVQFFGPPPADLKFRGIALNVFDGKEWKNQALEQENIVLPAGRSSLRGEQIARHNIQPTSHRAQFLRYRVVMEPIGTNVLFLAPVPVEIAGRFRDIAIDESGSISNVDPARLTESYEAVSEIATPPAESTTVAPPIPDEITLLYTQLHSVDPRIHDLAVQITAGIESPHAKAAAIERYLRESFSYTLELPSRSPEDPIAQFLFERKRGHCEYFASSMAVMLRAIGIPSRIVNGFRNGEFNDLTGNYIVRARNAHTWVEAYMPDAGWVSFDPTPAGLAELNSNFSRVRMYLDAAQTFWREWIINYDFNHQRNLTLSTVGKAQETAYRVRRWFRHKYHALLNAAKNVNLTASRSPRKWTLLFFLLIAVGATTWNFRAIARSIRDLRLAHKPSKSPHTAATIWYSRMLRTVARRGFSKSATQTPTEFATSITDATLRTSVEKFTERYQRARFGQSVSDAEQLPKLYEELSSKR